MKKLFVILLASLCLPMANASKLSKYLNKMEEKEKAANAQELKEDMNFSDMAFRLDRRYTNDRGDRCRDYTFRSRSNPYRQGHYLICDER